MFRAGSEKCRFKLDNSPEYAGQSNMFMARLFRSYGSAWELEALGHVASNQVSRVL